MNVGLLEAGRGRNIIPDRAFLRAEVRADGDSVVSELLARARAVASGNALAHGVVEEFETKGRTTSSDSDPGLARLVAAAAVGCAGLVAEPAPFAAYGSEDATYFMQRVHARGGRAIQAIVGSDLASGHHTSRFDIDEAVLGPAVEALTRAVLTLNRPAT